jgi:hypothetical protein
MPDEPDRCALDGCDEVIIQPPGNGPPRKYCCPAHKAEGRRLRRAEHRMVEEETTPTPEDKAAPSYEPTPDHEPTPGYEAESVPAGAFAGLPEQAELDEMLSAPEVAELPDPQEFHPKHETVKHSSTSKGSSTSNRSRANKKGSGANNRAQRTDKPRKRTKLITVTVAALVATGGVVNIATPRQSAPPMATPLTKPPEQLTPDPNTWSTEARTNLLSVNSQLERLDAAQRTWDAMPLARRTAAGQDFPAQISKRRASLQSQQAMLQAALGNWDNLKGAEAASDTMAKQLSALDQAIADAPGDDTDGLLGRLKAQRDTLRRQSDNTRQVLTNWRGNVMASASAPLPNERAAGDVEELSRAIDNLANQPQNHRDPAGDARLLSLSAQERRSKNGAIVTTSAPPNHRTAALGGLIRVGRAGPGAQKEKRGGLITIGGADNKPANNKPATAKGQDGNGQPAGERELDLGGGAVPEKNSDGKSANRETKGKSSGKRKDEGSTSTGSQSSSSTQESASVQGNRSLPSQEQVKQESAALIDELSADIEGDDDSDSGKESSDKDGKKSHEKDEKDKKKSEKDKDDDDDGDDDDDDDDDD